MYHTWYTRHNERVNGESAFDVEHLLYLEFLMQSGRAEEFRTEASGEWNGEESAKKLSCVAETGERMSIIIW